LPTNLEFKSVIKDRLFYSRFQYCLGFNLDEATCLRELDHAKIDDLIHRRKQWQEVAQQRWINGRQNTTILSRRWKEITANTVTDLHSVADVLLTSTAEFKLVVSVHQGYVYSNDLALLAKLDDMPELTCKTRTQARVDRPENTIRLKKSNYNFRSYFRTRHLSAQEKQQLVNFLNTQQDFVRTSPAMNQWVQEPFSRLQDYYFVDHDSQQWLTLISLVSPGLIRKTMQILTDK
jgi:hypothetical protein